MADKRIWIFAYDVFLILLSLYVAVSFVLGERQSLLSPGFFVKQSAVLALVSMAFFLFFQTYKGVWRFVTWRQCALIVLTTGLASLIYWPLLTLAHMQPIEIPSLIVLVQWGALAALMILSRVLRRLFHVRHLAYEAGAQLETPVFRVILVGGKEGVSNFKRRYKALKAERYEVLGVVMDASSGASEVDMVDVIEGYDLLGPLKDLPDLIDNFNADGLHPHQILILEDHYLGSCASSLVSTLQKYHVSFAKMLPHVPLKVSGLNVEDYFHRDIPSYSLDAFVGKTVLVQGATTPIGEALCADVIKSGAAHLVMWDHNAADLILLEKNLKRLATPLVHGAKPSMKMTFETPPLEGEILTSELSKLSVDVVVNLRAFEAAILEPLNPDFSFDVYITENAKFAQACENANVAHYYFITQEAPHLRYATKLSEIMNPMLQSFCSVDHMDKMTYGSINLPFIAANSNAFFQNAGKHRIYSDDVSVVTPSYGAYIVGRIISSIMNDVSFDIDQDFDMEIVSFDALVEAYSYACPQGALGRQKPIFISAEQKTLYQWPGDKKVDAKLMEILSKRDYQGALSILEKRPDKTFMPIKLS